MKRKILYTASVCFFVVFVLCEVSFAQTTTVSITSSQISQKKLNSPQNAASVNGTDEAAVTIHLQDGTTVVMEKSSNTGKANERPSVQSKKVNAPRQPRKSDEGTTVTMTTTSISEPQK